MEIYAINHSTMERTSVICNDQNFNNLSTITLCFILGWNEDDAHLTANLEYEHYKLVQIPDTFPVYQSILNHSTKQYVEYETPYYLENPSRELRKYKWAEYDIVHFLNPDGDIVYENLSKCGFNINASYRQKCRMLYIEIINHGEKQYERIFEQSFVKYSCKNGDIIIE